MSQDEEQKKSALHLVRGGQSKMRGRRRGPAFRTATELAIRESLREEFVDLTGRRNRQIARGDAAPPGASLLSWSIDAERRRVPGARQKAERIARKIIEGVWGKSATTSGEWPAPGKVA